MVKKLDIKPNAAVAFDWKCQAVHVALSPWRFYLDVKYEPGLRITDHVGHFRQSSEIAESGVKVLNGH